MSKPRVFVTRIIPEGGLALIRAACDADVWPEELPPPRPVLLEKVRGIDGLLCLLTDQIDGEVMDAAGPGLRVISNHAVGYDNVDVAAATARGIPVGNTPGILTETTADFAFALLMAAARRVVEGADYVRAGKWRTWGPMTPARPRRTRRDAGVGGHGADRAGDGPPGGRLWDEGHLLRSLFRRGQGSGGRRGGSGHAGRAAGRGRLCQPARAADRGDPPPDRRPGAGQDASRRRC